jgi:hypothetical protein
MIAKQILSLPRQAAQPHLKRNGQVSDVTDNMASCNIFETPPESLFLGRSEVTGKFFIDFAVNYN